MDGAGTLKTGVQMFSHRSQGKDATGPTEIRFLFGRMPPWQGLNFEKAEFSLSDLARNQFRQRIFPV